MMKTFKVNHTTRIEAGQSDTRPYIIIHQGTFPGKLPRCIVIGLDEAVSLVDKIGEAILYLHGEGKAE